MEYSPSGSRAVKRKEYSPSGSRAVKRKEYSPSGSRARKKKLRRGETKETEDDIGSPDQIPRDHPAYLRAKPWNRFIAYRFNAPGVREEEHARASRRLGLNYKTLDDGSNTIDAVFLTFFTLLSFAAMRQSLSIPYWDWDSDEWVEPQPIIPLQYEDYYEKYQSFKVGKRNTTKEFWDMMTEKEISVEFQRDITKYNYENTFICAVSALNNGETATHKANSIGFLKILENFANTLGTTAQAFQGHRGQAGHSGFIIFEITSDTKGYKLKYTTHGLLFDRGTLATLFPHNNSEKGEKYECADAIIQGSLVQAIIRGDVEESLFLHDVSKILAPVKNGFNGTILDSLVYYSCYLNGIENIPDSLKTYRTEFIENNNINMKGCKVGKVRYSFTTTYTSQPLCPHYMNCMLYVSLILGSGRAFASSMSVDRMRGFQELLGYSERTVNMEQQEAFDHDWEKYFLEGVGQIFGLTRKEEESRIGKLYRGFRESLGRSKRKNKKGKKKNPKTGKKKKGKKKNPKTGRKKRV